MSSSKLDNATGVLAASALILAILFLIAGTVWFVIQIIQMLS